MLYNNLHQLHPVLFPDFHTDTIRELSVNPKISHLVISGGFDGNVFVTDISRLVDDIQRNEKKSENSVYLCKDVVGSVNWHPNDCNVASCTTDLGVLHVFDIRTDQVCILQFCNYSGQSHQLCHQTKPHSNTLNHTFKHTQSHSFTLKHIQTHSNTRVQNRNLSTSPNQHLCMIHKRLNCTLMRMWMISPCVWVMEMEPLLFTIFALESL